MRRRTFIKNSANAIASVPFILNGISMQGLGQSGLLSTLNQETDRVLVLIQLQGGNDGLNTIIPMDGYDNLANLRSNIILPQNDILPLNGLTGMHPSMTGIKNLWDDGKFSIIQSVGYPNQNRSHFRSTDIWNSASGATEIRDSGWFGRYLSGIYPSYPTDYPNTDTPDPIAVTMGYVISNSCQGPSSNFSISIVSADGLFSLSESPAGTVSDDYYGSDLQFIRQSVASNNGYVQTVSQSLHNGSNQATYPDTEIGQQLKNVAKLISGGLSTKIYVCNLGGFDTHAQQVEPGQPTLGKHAEQLGELSDAIAAFQNDLKNQSLEERVIGLAVSEFGRQIGSNGSFGTDHGTAAPIFLFGSCVKNGILGDNPEIPVTTQPNEAIAMQFDFRDIYGSLLMDWFGTTQQTIEEIIYPDFQYIPLTNCPLTETRIPINSQKSNFDITPNPVFTKTQISFDCDSGRIKLRVFDSLGHQIETIIDRYLGAGSHAFTYLCPNLPAGNYYIHLQTTTNQKAKMFTKIG